MDHDSKMADSASGKSTPALLKQNFSFAKLDPRSSRKRLMSPEWVDHLNVVKNGNNLLAKAANVNTDEERA